MRVRGTGLSNYHLDRGYVMIQLASTHCLFAENGRVKGLCCERPLQIADVILVCLLYGHSLRLKGSLNETTVLMTNWSARFERDQDLFQLLPTHCNLLLWLDELLVLSLYCFITIRTLSLDWEGSLTIFGCRLPDDQCSLTFRHSPCSVIATSESSTLSPSLTSRCHRSPYPSEMRCLASVTTLHCSSVLSVPSAL